MANTRLHAMTESTSTNDTDELYLIISPFTSGYDRRMSIANLRTSLLSGIRGYTLQVGTYNTNPADATTYYFGGLQGAGLGTTGGGRRIYIPRAGTVTKAYLVFTCSTGSNETSTVSFRLNDTTDTTISTTVALNASPHVASKTDLSISVSAGDFFEIKWVSPTWATNPTAVSVSGVIWIE